MEIECPKCEYLCDVDDDLPSKACDDGEHNCLNCEHNFKIGWTAEAELR